MSGVRFEKYEGLGNDFIVVDAASDDAVSPTLARALCDRRFGVGADGVLLVLPATSPEGAARMKVINADGSIPEMCGNGLRCVALHLARALSLSSSAATWSGTIDTDAGPRKVTLALAREDEACVTCDMGEIRVLSQESVDAGGERVEIVIVDAGNPHAVLWPPSAEHDRARLERLGPILERHPLFPRGTNVELVSPEQDGFRLTVWERGAGLTMACGTGACATLAALVARGVCPEGEAIAVRLPGGSLSVSIDAGRATMKGPARRVFSGRTP